MVYIVDLRSDTVTKPTQAMKHAMVNSELGDDSFGEDPTVNALETKLAAMLGKQAALFVPSGTMANLIAIIVYCNKRGSVKAEVFAGDKSHLHIYEKGVEQFGGVHVSTLENKPNGTFDLDELESRIRSADIDPPVTSLVIVENTHNLCGGKVIPLEFLDDLAALCKRHSLPVHMDGIRLFNASEYSKETPARIVRDSDSVSVCFCKGLSNPVGSALVGSYDFIAQARRIRKNLGGGMRQAGVLAATAIVALDEVVPLLTRDHERAQTLAKAIQGLSLKTFTVDAEGVHTNIVLIDICEHSDVTADQLLQRLAQIDLAETQGECKTPNDEGVVVKAMKIYTKAVRFTLHQDINDEDLRLAIMKIIFALKELDGSV